ncbi:MAG: 50S ribosomal protein L24 [Bacteroidales bacterium]|jgi:large subunit ribosomal protein L24|nr:50S ribosomal protein L24 [Bacteroidales bacterium]
MKIHVKKGDIVKLLAGNDKGKQGKVLRVDTENYRAVVEGVNMISKATKADAKHPNGGIVKKEASVHISNLMVIDSKGNATRIGRKLGANGKLVRYSKKSGEEIK